jgi:hypothetical protein
MAQFATEEWIKLWADAINNSAAYEAAAQTWEGDFYMIVEAGGPIKEPVYQYINLWHGKCRKAGSNPVAATNPPSKGSAVSCLM